MKIRLVVILSLLGLFLSILLVLAGVFILRRNGIGWGLGAIVTAIGLFITSIVLTEFHPPTEEEAAAYKRYIIPAFFILLSLGLIFLTVYIMADLGRSVAMNRWLILAWIAGMICAAIGVLWVVQWRPPHWGSVKEWFNLHRQELLILAGILLVGLFLRLYLLEQHPFPWSGDEASVGTEARRIIQKQVTDFFDAGWSGQPNWSFVPTTISLILFGETFFAIRLVSAVEGTLAVLFLFLAARELFGKRVALLAAGFLATFPYHLQFSRIGVNNVVDSLMVCLIVWLVMRAIRRGGVDDFLWAGLATGLTFYTYVGSRLILGLVFLVLIYVAIRRKGFLKERWTHLLVFLFGTAISIAPMAYYFIRHPDVFMTRLGQESILINHWLTLQSERTGQTVLALLWRQFTDTVLVYISQPAVGNFFNSPYPYLTLIGSIFFLFGLGYAFLRFFKIEMITLMAWFWSVVILGGVMTTSPPANTRLIMTAPAVAIFLALGLEKFGEILIRFKILIPKLHTVLAIVIVVILGIQNTYFYFGEYRTGYYFEDATGELTQAVGLELKQLGPNYDYYLFGLPRIFAGFPTIVFLNPMNGMYDVTADSIENMNFQPGRGALIVAIPENLAILQLVAERYPGGTWEEVPRVHPVETLYYGYILPPSAIP